LPEAGEPTSWLLWDASAVLSYYLPELAPSPKATARTRIILDAVRNHRLVAHCYIPNLVVAESFAALDRACYSKWDSQINRQFGGQGRTLDARRRRTIRKRVRRDIHNGRLFYQYDLTRYHILALDLIAPIDKHRKFYRTRNVRSMGASDLLIGAMGIHLAKIHGRERLRLLTTDRRMRAIFDQAPQQLAANTARYLGLPVAAEVLGFGEWAPDLYPRVLDLARCSDSDLNSFFGQWPLSTRKVRGRRPRA
jgi:hypothetical protein